MPKKNAASEQLPLLVEDTAITAFRDITIDTFFDKNIVSMPICFMDKKRTGSQDIILIKVKTKHGSGTWKVSPNVEHGAAGPFDDLVLMAISKIISEYPKPLRNPINIGSLRNIARVIGISAPSSKELNAIKTAINRLSSLLITSEFTFYHKATGKFLKEKEGSFYIIYKKVFTSEELENGEIANSNLIWLDDKILDNINMGYVCPMDAELYFGLNPIARAVLKLIMESFFASAGNSFVRYFYSTVCDRSTIKRRRYKAQAIQQLQPGLDELISRGIIKHYTLEDVATIKNDWYLSLYKGPTWLKYYNNLEHKSTVPEVEYHAEDAPPSNEHPVYLKLVELGIDHSAAETLLASKNPDFIQKCIDYYLIVKNSKEVSPGWLRNTILKAKELDIDRFLKRVGEKQAKETANQSKENQRLLYENEKTEAIKRAFELLSQPDKDALEQKARSLHKSIGSAKADNMAILGIMETLILKDIDFPKYKKWCELKKL